MKERPILFSGQMVRVILDCTKTQTRRVISPQPISKSGPFPNIYGIGQKLWVRETWRVGAWNEEEGLISVDYRSNNCARREWLSVEDDELFERLWIQSSDDARDAGLKCGDEGYKWKPGESPCRWRPSIFMPRWASRITLKVTDVRVEHVQSISSMDAEAEGVQCQPMSAKGFVDYYRELWDALNAKRGFGWDTNPWVWAIEFKRVT